MGAKNYLSMLELRQLRHALALSKARNFHKAAKAEHITQPALSKSIHSLEHKLNKQLFQRHPNGVRPTLHGLTVVRYSQQVMKTLQEMLQSLENNFSDCTDLTLGIDSSVSEWLAGDILETILFTTPNARIHTVFDMGHNLKQSLLDGTLDIALFTTEEKISYPNRMKWQLPTLDGVIYVKRGHSLDGKPAVLCKELLTYPYVGTHIPKQIASWIIQETAEKKIDNLPRINCATQSLSHRCIKTTDGWGCAPLHMIKQDLDTQQFTVLATKNLKYEIQPYVLSSSAASDNPLVQSIIEKALQLPVS